MYIWDRHDYHDDYYNNQQISHLPRPRIDRLKMSALLQFTDDMNESTQHDIKP